MQKPPRASSRGCKSSPRARRGDSNLSITRGHLSRRQWRTIGPLKVPEKRRKAPGPGQWPWRAHTTLALVAFFPWIFPRCRASKKATDSESWPRKIHRNHRHWRSRSVLTPPIEEPGTRENRARVHSLSLPGFSRLSRACLSFPFSLSLYRCRLHHPVFFSFFVLRVFSPGST